MFPNRFDYHAPNSVEEALSLLEQYPYDGKLLAGGHSLLPMMKLRVAAPSVLIDINHIDALKGVQLQAGSLRIGALTRHGELERADEWHATFPLLQQAAEWIADPSIRNRGTIGGSLAHADPASDWGTAMIALRAEVEIATQAGTRLVQIDDFFVDTFTPALEEGEILTAIHIPVPEGMVGSRYMKLERKAGDFAIAGLAVQIEWGADGLVKQAGIGICNCGPVPLRAKQAEAALVGKALTVAVIEEAARLVAEDSDPVSDLRGTAEYKADLLRVFAKRALAEIQNDHEGEVKAS